MVADIHGVWVQRREYGPESRAGETWDNIGTVEGWRNYAIFGLLAGVRGGPPLYEPRGYPETRYFPWKGVRVGDHSEENGWCHSASYLYLGELREVRHAYRERVLREDGESAGKTWLDWLIALMEAAEEPDKPCRAVFCFDN